MHRLLCFVLHLKVVFSPEQKKPLRGSGFFVEDFMGRPGFEPGTNRLKAEYSTIELATHCSSH